MECWQPELYAVVFSHVPPSLTGKVFRCHDKSRPISFENFMIKAFPQECIGVDRVYSTSGGIGEKGDSGKGKSKHGKGK